MSAGDVHSILYRGKDPSLGFKPKYDPTKRVLRHWPGKVVEEHEEHSLDGSENGDVVEEPLGELVVDTAQQDHRLRRLAQQAPASVAERIKEREQRLRAIEDARELNEEPSFPAPVVAEAEHIVLNRDVDEEAIITARREKIREHARKKRKAEEEKLDEFNKEGDILSGDSVDEESDFESDFEDEVEQSLARPLFVPKDSRVTAKEREIAVKLEVAQQEEQRKKLVERKHQSHQLLIETIRNEETEALEQRTEGGKDNAAFRELPDDADDVNEQEEYENWKLRELRRIKRDKEARLREDLMAAELERRRQMTEQERREDDRRLDEQQPHKESSQKYAFMQKYYHKGAYFQDKTQTGEEPLYLRDYTAPVGEDKLDKLSAPKAMRLRRGELGRIGRTKHTHLLDVDTSTKDSPWQADVAKTYYKNMERSGNLDRPKPSKK